MSKVGGLGLHEVGGYYIHSEYIWHRLLVFFMTTSNCGGAQPPLIKMWASPPCPPRFSAPGLCAPVVQPPITSVAVEPGPAVEPMPAVAAAAAVEDGDAGSQMSGKEAIPEIIGIYMHKYVGVES